MILGRSSVALLEALDPEQNKDFPITTILRISRAPRSSRPPTCRHYPLPLRIAEVIRFSSHTRVEKFHIAKSISLKVIEKNGLGQRSQTT